MSENISAGVAARIRKLLALAGNNSNEHEAQAAAAKAQALLQEYNLEMSGFAGEAETGGDAERTKAQGVTMTSTKWQLDLLGAVASGNFCLLWTEGVTGDVVRCNLIGRRVNVVTTTEVYRYLVLAVERLCPHRASATRVARAWKDGCVGALAARLREQRLAAEAEGRRRRGETRGSGSDLVLADVYASEEDLNEDARRGLKPGTTAAERARMAAKWEAGRAAREAREAEQRARWDAEAATARKGETPAQREAREAKEKRDSERYWQRWEREQVRTRGEREARAAGAAAGASISLARQVGETRKIG